MDKKVVQLPKPLLAHLIEEEQKRNASLEARYKKALEALPKGKFYIRKVKSRRASGKQAVHYYVYLSRRVSGRQHPESKYIGLVGSERAKEVQKQLEDREKLEQQLMALKVERRMMDKALHEYRRSR